MCEHFRTMPLVLCNIQPFQYKKVKTQSHKNWNLGLSLHFSWTILISFVMQTKQTPFRYKKCVKFTVGQTSD